MARQNVKKESPAFSRWRRLDWGPAVPIIVSHLAIVVIWQVYVYYSDVPSYLLPSPLETISTLFSGNYDWWTNSFVTISEIYIGYIVSVIFGIAMALTFYWFRTFSILAFPLFVTLSMIPKVALGPLFVVWFGYGIGTNIFIAFIISFFPILLTTWRGLKEVEPELLELVSALKATRWQIFTKIQLPNALPYIFSGMKVGSVLAVAGAIVGEFIASDKGLGYLMIQVQAALDTAAMFMAVIILTLVGIILYGLIIALERYFVVADARIE